MLRRRLFFIAAGVLCVPLAVAAQQVTAPAPAAQNADASANPGSSEAADRPAPLSVEELTKRASESIVVVEVRNRDGKQYSIGSGFAIAPGGLIATNLHVIGEARPVSVQLTDGREFDVESIYASDRALDLAVLKIPAEDLVPLELGDSDELVQGQDVVALGHPQGLKHSVVAGIVSGRRVNDGVPMIQLAMPIETGNSGGPVLDRFGRVHGIVTLKSVVTANLGFAVTINSLKPLLAKPNPIAMETWQRIGALDDTEWTQLFGATWRRRADRILVDGHGAGIGRRSLCLHASTVPEKPYEVAVQVRLQKEDGAAGLVFCSDGGERHYGFYPSNGNLRLSRFDGPDVYSWNVLEQVESPHYKPGEWNRLKVRVEVDRFLCYVNEQLVIESTDQIYSDGQVGLAQFRGTETQFRNFQLADSIPSALPSKELYASIADKTANIPSDGPLPRDLIGELAEKDALAGVALHDRAQELERQAQRLKELAVAVRVRRVQRQLVEIFKQSEREIDLIHAALLLAKLDQDELDVDAYRDEVDRMAADLQRHVPEDATAEQKIELLNEQFFETMGFHGSRIDFYNRANSYLNEVIDNRKGLPITLSVLYIELGRRIGLEIHGVGLPGRFIVSASMGEDGARQLIDVFDDGAAWSRERASLQVKTAAGRELKDEDLASTPRRAIIIRMLHNLFGVAKSEEDVPAMLRYVDTIVAVDPEAEEPGTATDRMYRAALLLQAERIDDAREDVDWLLRTQSDETLLYHVRRLRSAIEAADR